MVFFAIIAIGIMLILQSIAKEDKHIRKTCRDACAQRRNPSKCEKACWKGVTSDEALTPEERDY